MPNEATAASPFDALKRKITGKPSAATIAAALDDLTEIKAGLQARHADLAQARADSLLTASEGDLAKAREAMGVVSDQIEVAAAWRTRLAADHVCALAAEEDARRRAVYAAALAKLGKPAAFNAAYRKAATSLLAAVRAMAEASITVAEANAALPAGVDPLLDPIGDFLLAAKGLISTGQPREVLSEKQVERWCFADSGTPIGDQKSVCVDEGNPSRGYVSSNAGSEGRRLAVAGNILVEKRAFLEVTSLPATYNQWAHAGTNLSLPGLYAPSGFDLPTDAAGYLPAIDAALAASDAPAVPPKRERVVELVPVSDDGEVLERAA